MMPNELLTANEQIGLTMFAMSHAMFCLQAAAAWLFRKRPWLKLLPLLLIPMVPISRLIELQPQDMAAALEVVMPAVKYMLIMLFGYLYGWYCSNDFIKYFQFYHSDSSGDTE